MLYFSYYKALLSGGLEKVGRIGTRTASLGMRKGVDGLERLGRCSDRSERGSKLGIWNSDLEIELDMDSYLTCELEGYLHRLSGGSRYRFAPFVRPVQAQLYMLPLRIKISVNQINWFN